MGDISIDVAWTARTPGKSRCWTKIMRRPLLGRPARRTRDGIALGKSPYTWITTGNGVRVVD